MTQSKMYERVNKWVEKQYPAYEDFNYEVSMHVLDNWYLEVNVATESNCYQCFITVPEDGRKGIVVEDITEYKRFY